MDTMITQLVITPSYPPVDSSVTLINIKIIERLEEIGVRTVVLTIDPADVLLPVNERLKEIFPSNRKVYRLKTWEKGGALYRGIRAFLRKTPLFNAPDFHLLWEISAIASLRRIARENDIDVIHSISAPYCSHIVGLFAKAMLKKPWVCHLDDFWADQLVEHFDRYRFLNYWLERECFSHADAVLSSSREILDFARKRYPRNITSKFVYIPPSYDPRDYPDTYVKNLKKFVFTYLGVFYPDRREPGTFLKALELLRTNNPGVFYKIETHFIGKNARQWEQSILSAGLGDTVKVHDSVDYRQSMRRMKEAAVLLHLGYMNGKLPEDVHVSGKLFEYFGAQRLVLGITTPTGPVADIIGETGGVVANYNDPNDIAKKIAAIVENYSLGDLYNRGSLAVVSRYDIKAVGGEYLELMQRVMR